MMLGLLLARAGVDVIVLEKHADFLRDFRGDTVHPSTLEVMYELGLLDRFLKLPHQQVTQLRAWFGDMRLTFADFTHVPTHAKFLALMPQWDFLDFLAREAARSPAFHLRMKTEVTDVIRDGERVMGVRARGPEGPLEIRANLVIGADGRQSIVRERARLPILELGAPMDVLWFALSRKPDDPEETMGRFDTGRIFISLNRGAHWQCGFVIPKGQIEQVRARGLDAFRAEVRGLAPYTGDRVAEIRSWDDVKLLTVRVDRLLRWYQPGVLCIGDAAHAMSPIGGVGINLAIQDAVAAANLLAAPLRDGRVTVEDLARVQKRREFPTRVTQWAQVAIQRRIISRVLSGTGPLRPPLAIRALAAIPALRRIPARLVGVGVRPEHVQRR
jgi:2-polyprenyl-6-methoxyphenol hydroxylase-like FAD-dependent oxidoreductase